jgi:hypothetical protein
MPPPPFLCNARAIYLPCWPTASRENPCPQPPSLPCSRLLLCHAGPLRAERNIAGPCAQLHRTAPSQVHQQQISIHGIYISIRTRSCNSQHIYPCVGHPGNNNSQHLSPSICCWWMCGQRSGLARGRSSVRRSREQRVMRRPNRCQRCVSETF